MLGCAAAPPQRSPFPIPDPAGLSATERLGFQLYQLDQAAWIATDAMLGAGLGGTPAQGWLALPAGPSFVVRFVGACGDVPCSYIDIYLQSRPPEVVKLDPPVVLPETEAAMWRARQLALASNFRKCTPTYNTVVVPVEPGAAAWRVYLLAASSDSDVVVLVGHHRVTVSPDGRSILSEEPLSKSCMVNELDPNVKVTGLFVTHVLHPEPIETHVFTSLTYRLPLYVGTEQGKFKVEGASIRLLEGR